MLSGEVARAVLKAKDRYLALAGLGRAGGAHGFGYLSPEDEEVGKYY